MSTRTKHSLRLDRINLLGAEDDDEGDADKTDTMTSAAGTAQWMAPEILQNGVYSAAADVYSFGVVLGEMLSGEVPWL